MTQADLPRPSFSVRPTGGRIGLAAAATFAAIAVLLVIAAPRAGAAISDVEELTRFGSEGTAAGQLTLPRGIAADPVTGHVFVSERDGRVSEFTPWGEFVKAFGWDVAPGAVNEQQEVRVSAAAGQFKLTFHAETTANLPFDAGAGEVETALDALASLGAGAVRVREVAGALDGSTPIVYVIAFNGASVKASDVERLAAVNGTTPLSGGIPSSGVLVGIRADGHAAGAGLESCTAESGCQAGLHGAGVGQFGSEVPGVAVDASGNVYVTDASDNRLQKFDSAGRFVLMVGGEVDKTTHANLCTAVSGDECGIGVAGNGNGQFGPGGPFGVAFCPSGTLCPSGALFVGDAERIERFNLGGEFEVSIHLPGETVQTLAIDPSRGYLYASTGLENLFKLDATTGTELGRLEGEGALATDAAGDLFAPEPSSLQPRVLEFDSGGKPLSPSSCCTPPPANQIIEPFQIQALATNTIGDLYVANARAGVDTFIRSFGPAPANFEAPPKVPPTIESQYAVSADFDSAALRVQINPHFWSNTTYYVQYGTANCEVSVCAAQFSPPGSRLTPRVLDTPVSGDVALSGLQPDTTYHYRFVSESGGGGPVFGPDHTFNTFPALSVNTDCPNQALRTGFSALLADCRAYEMVSPLDKDNGEILALKDVSDNSTALDQSSTSGEELTYSSSRAFGDVKAAPYTSQYIAARNPASGWSTEAISPPQRLAAGLSSQQFQNDYRLFSPDLSSAWLLSLPEPLLASGAVEGFPNLYRRDDLSGSFEALTTVEPQNVKPSEYAPELQGVSADASRSVFRANDTLTSDAASEKGIYQLYESTGGGSLRLVSVLPDGTASTQDPSVGTFNGIFTNSISSLDRVSSVDHAVSDDGSRVYWSESRSTARPGKIYLRENADQEQSALSGEECLEPAKACTIAVSSKAARFWDANPDGSRALYTVAEGAHNGELDEFNVEEDASTTLAGEVFGVLGASEDLSYVYFLSGQALAEGATVGQPNLYLRHGEATSFIATLSSVDTGSVTSASSNLPVNHAARVTRDGLHLAFISAASLTGYDNNDAVTGKPDSEVYAYDAGSQRLACVSCDRSLARPYGRIVQPPGDLGGSLATAASVPGWQSEFYASRALSDDGGRLFFDSYDALVPRDTNGMEDVYEWEVVGSGDCTAQSAAFSPVNEGCVSLISSGESPQDSEFLDASPDGGDVFFATAASLLTQDRGLLDIYDARVDGGLPPPPATAASCEGEACQGIQAPPNDSTPASASFNGPGDLVSVLATGPNTTVHPQPTAAQIERVKLAKALKACRKKARAARVRRCEAAARKRDRATPKNGATKSSHGRGK